MSEVEITIEQLEAQRVGLKKQVELRDAAIRLSKNRDFQTLIMEYFMKEEAARYVHTSADPAVPAESRADALAVAQASGHLKRFLSVIVRMGDTAADQIGAIDTALDEERARGDSPQAEEEWEA